MRARHHIDIRIEKPNRWDWIPQFPSLLEIDFQPPSSGPEIELTFSVRSRGGKNELEIIEADLCGEVRHHTKRTILASRVRDWSDRR